MLERTLEIIVRRCTSDVFGPGWKLVAQQLGLPSGRIDLLVKDTIGKRYVVELKKGRATKKAIEQVMGYAADLEIALDGKEVTPIVLANEIAAKVKQNADQVGCLAIALSQQRCDEIVKKNHLSEKDLLGVRKDRGVLNGGGAKRGLSKQVDNEIAYLEIPKNMVQYLRKLSARKHMDIASGGMQTVLHYRGVKLGGVNRIHRGGMSYIGSGVILSDEAEKRLEEIGYRRMTEVRSGAKHEHIWWETSSTDTDAFETAIGEACDLVDRALGVKNE